MKKNLFFIILFYLVICSGCVADTYGNHAADEKTQNRSPYPAVTAYGSPGLAQCSREEVSGLEDTYIEFLPGETQKTIQYRFSNTLARPTDVSYTLVPVSNWGEKDPVVLPDWVNISVEPSSLSISPCRNETSTIHIRLIRNTTDNSASSLLMSRTAFFYLKTVTNFSSYTDEGDWLCVQENTTYRTLMRPRLKATIEHADIVIHPGSGNQSSLIINTQSQGLDSVRFGVQPEDTGSAAVLEEGLLQIQLDPPAFSTRSFRQYNATLMINSSNRLPSGTYRFTIAVQSKSLAQLHLRVEAIPAFQQGLYKEGLDKAAGYTIAATPCTDCPLPLTTPLP